MLGDKGDVMLNDESSRTEATRNRLSGYLTRSATSFSIKMYY